MRHRRRSLLLAVVGTLLLLPVLLFAGAAFLYAQRADYGWRPAIATPAHPARGPRVAIDEGHANASTAGVAGRYFPFARLLRADGYVVERMDAPFTRSALSGVRVLVIANASGAERTQWFGINLPFEGAGEREDPAFTRAEIAVLRGWVQDGGSLLLIADHAPFGASAAPLAAAFGVRLHQGFTELDGESSDPMRFSRSNGRLGAHPIVDGTGLPGGAVGTVMTFTGESLDAPAGASELLRLPHDAVEWVTEAGKQVARPAGRSQGVALQVGRGRVVVLGEAAMLTAQVAEREPFGFQTGDNDNIAFARNVVAWLAGPDRTGGLR